MFFGQWDCDSFLPSEETNWSRGFGIDEVNDTFNFAYGFKTFVALHNFVTMPLTSSVSLTIMIVWSYVHTQQRMMVNDVVVLSCYLAPWVSFCQVSNCLLIAFLSSVASVTYQTRNVHRIQKSLLYRLFYTASWFSRKKNCWFLVKFHGLRKINLWFHVSRQAYHSRFTDFNLSWSRITQNKNRQSRFTRNPLTAPL